MSALKTFALGLTMLAIAVPSAPGGSIQHSNHRKDAVKVQAEPTTLVFGPVFSGLNANHKVGFENLALTGTGYDPSASGVGQYPVSWSRTGGLFIAGAATPNSVTPVIAPVVAPNLATTYSTPPTSVQTPTPTPTPASTPVLATPSSHPDAFINFGNGPYAEASTLTTGTAQGFFTSPVFTHFFGVGGPTLNDVGKFENEVLATIKSTYNNAGLAITLTTDPNAMAAHTMSIVSGATYTGNSGVIGITDVGNNGFSFIDKLGGTPTVDQLAIAVGHNLSHELMHAFGIANHPEQTGAYVDAATTTLKALEDPSTGFSSAASSLLSTLNFEATGQSVTASTGAQGIDGGQVLVGSPSTVPEPTTLAAWVVLGGLLVAHRRRKVA